jgi:protein phosphatase
MIFDVASLSEAGPRAENEDSVVANLFAADHLLIGVADGLVGHLAGKIASKLAIARLLSKLEEHPDANLVNLVLQIHSEIRSEQLAAKEQRSMATTLSAGVLHKEHMKFVHCGDTRITVARANGIRRLTKDHSEAQRLFDAGKISREQLANYPRKNILDSALGIKGTPRIDEGVFRLVRGDKIFVTSDGFHNSILLRELFAMAKSYSDAARFLDFVAREMKMRGADDNYSLVCAFIR